MMMRKSLFVLIVLTLGVTAYAQELYIKVMSVRSAKTSEDVRHRLKAQGHEVYIATHKEWKLIYVGPFKDRKSANKVLCVLAEEVAEDATIVGLSPGDKKGESTLKRSAKVKKESLSSTSSVSSTASKVIAEEDAKIGAEYKGLEPKSITTVRGDQKVRSGNITSVIEGEDNSSFRVGDPRYYERSIHSIGTPMY